MCSWSTTWLQQVPKHKLGKLETERSAVHGAAELQQRPVYLIAQGFNNVKNRNVYERHGAASLCMTSEVIQDN